MTKSERAAKYYQNNREKVIAAVKKYASENPDKIRERSARYYFRGSTYNSWTSMKQRCNNPKQKSWPDYGGRGITYDPRWEVYSNFYDDMGERPEGKTLDRIDVNGNYTKDNCQWASHHDQRVNRRDHQNRQ